MSIYILSQILVFLICSFLSIKNSKAANKIAIFITSTLTLFGIIFFTLTLINSKDGYVWTGGFDIPNLRYNISSLPLLIIFNFLISIYLFSVSTKIFNFQQNTLIVALINFHNFLLLCAIHTKELITFFFILEFISLANIGFILSSNSNNRKEVAMKYFIQNIVAGLLYVIGIIFFYKIHVTTEIIPFIESPFKLKENTSPFFNLECLLFFLLFPRSNHNFSSYFYNRTIRYIKP